MELLTIGKIGGTHHLKGAVKIHSNIGEALYNVVGQKVMIELNPENIKMVTVKSVAPLVGEKWIMEFDEITNKTDAGKLTKALIKARRDVIGVEDDEYLMNDLMDMQVFTEDGKNIGTVTNIFETAAHEILEVESETTEAMIPNVGEFVTEIDFVNRIIKVSLIEGMLEEKKEKKEKKTKKEKIEESQKRNAEYDSDDEEYDGDYEEYDDEFEDEYDDEYYENEENRENEEIAK